jgi:hypothetical protein
MDMMTLQEFVFFSTKEKECRGIGGDDKAVGPISGGRFKFPHKGFKANTTARPRPEWTDDKVKTR